MAPRGRKKKGLMRDDAARDAMIEFGFEIRLINETIKELLELYNENAKSNPWKLIEEGGYAVLLERLLEKQAEQEKQLALHNKELTVEEQAEPTQEEEEEKSFVLKEEERHVEEGRDQIGSSSTALLGYGADTGKQTCQTDALSVTNEAVMDSTPAAFQSAEATADSVGVTNEAVMDSSPAALQSAEATAGSVGGTKSSHCGWLSSEEESESEEDGDDGDEMIQLSPEPLCEELEDLLAEIRGDKKRKRPTRWDN